MRAKGLGQGSVETLPSGRFRAAFRTPTGTRQRKTFNTRRQADLWLAAQQVDVARGVWAPPKSASPTFGDYAAHWVRSRRNRRGDPLAPRTQDAYRRHLTGPLAELAEVPLDEITPRRVLAVYSALDATPAQQANTYGLLAAIMRTAVEDGLIDRTPCRIRGGGSKDRAHAPVILTPAELVALAERHPPHLQMLVLLTTFDTLRQGEAFELRRGDISPDGSELTVARAVTFTRGETHVRGPKSRAGRRTVTVPPHLRDALVNHLATWVCDGPDALVFTSVKGNRLRASTLYGSFYPARAAIGHPDLHWHDLRHTGATMAAQTGATLAELMALLGHSTVAAAMVYQHAVQSRRDVLAERMSELAGRPALKVVGA